MKKLLLFFLSTITFISSCTKDDLKFNENANRVKNEQIINRENNEKYLEEFAEILSKVIYERQDVREFLKTEALKQFDKNYDVLYYLIENRIIGDETFRNILISYSSQEKIESIEKNVPLLNIYLTNLEIIKIKAEDLDVSKPLIPTAVNKKNNVLLYLNGNLEMTLKNGELIGLHTFVVNQNKRVLLPKQSLKSFGANVKKEIEFISPNYDGKNSRNTSKLKFQSVGLPKCMTDAFIHFNKIDNSMAQQAFQRDYIYYGITPEKTSGQLNYNVAEYIDKIKVDPIGYNIFIDQTSELPNGDPTVTQETIITPNQLFYDQQVSKMWSEGAFNFKFEILNSTKATEQVVYIPLRPEEIWNLNIKSSKIKYFMGLEYYIYEMDPKKFTAREVTLENLVYLGKWHISDEALHRTVRIYEDDPGATETRTIENTLTHAKKQNFNGNTKLNIGLKDVGDVTVGGSADITITTTDQHKKSWSITEKKDADPLGEVKIYFYDPLITAVKPHYQFGHIFERKEYNTGVVAFSILIK